MRRIYCRYCGAKLRRDYVGLKCPTRSCQWEYGIDEEDSLNQSQENKK